jgi:hypothetical protein
MLFQKQRYMPYGDISSVVNVLYETDIVQIITACHIKLTVRNNEPIQHINRKNTTNLLEPAKKTVAAVGLVAYIAVVETSCNTAP